MPPTPRAAALLLLLAACGREPAPEPAAPASFRQAGAPIGSTTRGSPADLLGEWVVSAAFPGAPLVRPGSRVALSEGPGGRVVWSLDGAALPTAPEGPGRYAGGGLRLWVLWVDDDFRTAVVGTPDGSFGWVMDRPGEASADRAEAARAMLRFNGYDTGRLAGA